MFTIILTYSLQLADCRAIKVMYKVMIMQKRVTSQRFQIIKLFYVLTFHNNVDNSKLIVTMSNELIF